MNNTTNFSEQQIREAITVTAAAKGFPEYCIAIDPKYSLEWFHNVIGLRLEKAVKQVENGEDVRLMIFMPPRHGKSDEATQKFPSWALGEHPEWPFIVASYSQELATDFGQGTRDLMDSSNYKAIFETRLREDTTAKAKWMTEEKGGYTAVGVGGAITGRGFKVGILDDPFKNREEADSPVTRESVHKWWRSTFYTRQEGNTLIVVILTRWHDDDLAGRLLKEEKEAIARGETNYDKWEVLEFKAIAEQDDEYRKVGEALWPAKFDLPKLHKTKSALGSYEFSALYQQNPIDEENQEFKREWLQYRSVSEVEKMATRKFATIDPAGSKKKKSDSTGVTRNYVNVSNEWHFNTRRYRINSKGIIDLIFQLHAEGFEKIGIEEGVFSDAIEPFLKVEMERLGIYPNVVPLKHGGIMKETRIRGLIPRYENRKVWHIANTCADLEDEYLRFPKASHDDCLDSAQYQNQIAQPLVLDAGDTIPSWEIEKNISSSHNSQEDPIIIGINTGIPVRYVMGNKEGIFFNNADSTKSKEKIYQEIEGHLLSFKKCYVFANQVGDVLELKSLQDRFKGKIFICWLKTDVKSLEIVKWGKDSRFGEVDISRNALIQQIADEFTDSRLSLYGSKEDWKPYVEEFKTLYRQWESEPSGSKIYEWCSSAPQPFVNATIFYRVGLDRFSTSAATIIGTGPFEGMPTGRIFNDNSLFNG